MKYRIEKFEVYHDDDYLDLVAPEGWELHSVCPAGYAHGAAVYLVIWKIKDTQ